MTVLSGVTPKGDVCLDDDKAGHEHHETDLDADPGATQSALPTHIELRIAIESPNGYRNGQKWRLSGECRIKLSSLFRDGLLGRLRRQTGGVPCRIRL